MEQFSFPLHLDYLWRDHYSIYFLVCLLHKETFFFSGVSINSRLKIRPRR